ncbi:hypothetical protein Ancab_015069 [Ancistrocladus abbreviatus]
MRELTTLCGIEGCLFLFNPDNHEMFVWPSEGKAKELWARFEKMPKAMQIKKMVDHERYVKERNEKLRNEIAKQEKKNKEMKASLLMHQITHGRKIDELSIEELNILIWFSEEKLKYIQQWTQLFPNQSIQSSTTVSPACSAASSSSDDYYHSPANSGFQK